jgi:hypothetical protein
MPVPPRLRPAAVALVIVAALGLQLHQRAAHATPGSPGGVVRIDPTTADVRAVDEEDRSATLTFGPEVAPGDRAWIEQAIAAARPEAQRLIGQVDGLVTIHTASLGSLIMGVTRPSDGRFSVDLNITQLDGERTIDRDTVVLHELGHVIDYVLIPAATDAQLDAGIPTPTSCGDGGPFGGCAPNYERIADTFAKWALNGAVSAVGAGYGIPTPPSLESWGEPLAQLAAGLPA